MSKRFRFLATMLSIILVASLLASCAGQGQGQGAAGQAMDHINTASQIGGPQSNIDFVAQAQGFFEEEGITIEMFDFPSAVAMAEALPAGVWDLNTAGVPGWVVGGLNSDLTIIALGPWDIDGLDLYVRPDSEIALAGRGHIPGFPDIYGTPDMWRGLEILLPTGTNSHMILVATLGAMGLTEDDVTIVNMDVASAYTAFRAGQGDMAGSWLTNSMFHRQAGHIVASSAGALDLYIPIIVCVEPTLLRENPDLVTRYLRAWFRGAEFQQENHVESAHIMEEWNNARGFATTFEAAYDLISPRITYSPARQLEMFRSGEVDEILKYMLDFFISIGRWEEGLWDDIGHLIDTSILERLVYGD